MENLQGLARGTELLALILSREIGIQVTFGPEFVIPYNYDRQRTIRPETLLEVPATENEPACRAALRSNDFTSPPTYDRTTI